jgi:hypothetical protein
MIAAASIVVTKACRRVRSGNRDIKLLFSLDQGVAAPRLVIPVLVKRTITISIRNLERRCA